MIFPFTVPMDGAGKMRDPAQGMYARSLARTLAERLSAAPSMNAVAATLTSSGPVPAQQQTAPLQGAAPQGAAHHGAAQDARGQHASAQHASAHHGSAQHASAQHGAAQHGAAQHASAQQQSSTYRLPQQDPAAADPSAPDPHAALGHEAQRGKPASPDTVEQGWVVAGQPWTLDEACSIGLPEGMEYLLHGVAELTDRIRLRLLLVDQPHATVTLDHVVLRPRNELFSALDEAASAVATALGERLPDVEWPTRDVEAYVAYLRGRDMSAAHEAGVQVADPDKSFDGYLEAMRRDPHFLEAQDRVLALALDFALGGQGPVEAARAGCERLLKLDPAAYKAHAALAEIDLAQGEIASAVARLQTVLSIKPDWVPAYERLGTALLREGSYDEALEWLARAVQERPEDVDALAGLGVALAEKGRLEEAVKRFGEAIDKGGHSVALHENLARALRALGRHKEAREQRALARKLAGKAPFGLGWLKALGHAVSGWLFSEHKDG